MDFVWKSFSENLEKFGKERLIPILGSGFNLHACPNTYDWGLLLKEVAHFIDIEKELNYNLDVSSMTSIWEQFVITTRKKYNFSTLKSENYLKRQVIKCLNLYEEENMNNGFFKEFLKLGFKDIFSINFDRSLALRNNSAKKVITKFSKKAFKAQNSLFRHSLINDLYQNCRIWYPHGDTENYLTIKLGVRAYGLYIRSLSTAFKFYRTKQKTIKLSSKSLIDFCRKIRDLPAGELNWFWLGISSPIIFIGCSLSKDEWPLWWFLHQRARHLAHYSEGHINPAYVMLNIKSRNPKTRTLIKWLSESPASIQILPCNNWEQGWENLFKIMQR